MKLHITAQSGPVILVMCVCVNLLNCTATVADAAEPEQDEFDCRDIGDASQRWKGSLSR